MHVLFAIWTRPAASAWRRAVQAATRSSCSLLLIGALAFSDSGLAAQEAAARARSPGAAAADLPQAFSEAWQDLVREHRRELESQGVVGATLAFVRDGRIVAEDHFGMEDLAAGRPVDAHTIYHWASITKTFTGVAVMQLVEQGLLGLDDAIVEHVPELRRAHNPFGPTERITVRHLLSHSAGFRSPTWPWGGSEVWHPHEPTEWSQLVAMMPYTDVRFEPGSRFGYSNPGIVFLGRALERLTGDVYEAYIDKNMFDPLGMDSSYFDVTPWRLRDARSNNYEVVAGEPVPNGPDFNTGITVSNGGLNAPVHDMARWVGFLMGAPASRRTAYESVLPRRSLESMWVPVVPVSHGLGARVDMGLSFFLIDAGARRLVGHTGSQKSFRSAILLDPEANLALIAAYNTAGGDTTAPATDEIMSMVQQRAADSLFPAFANDN